MKKSVMSAVGSSEISGASRWLAAWAACGPVPGATTASSTAAAAARKMSARLRTGAAPFSDGRDRGQCGRPSRIAACSRESPKRFGSSVRCCARRSSAGDACARAALECLAERVERGDERLAAGPGEGNRSLHLWAHRAFGELRQQRTRVGGRERTDLFLIGLPEVPVDRGHLGQDYEPLGTELG